MSRDAVLSRVLGAAGSVLVWMTVPGVLSAAAGSARAQTKVADVAPYYAVVGEGGAGMRGQPNDLYYTVSMLPAGTVVLADGESGAWSRVAYPYSVGVYARVEDVEVSGATAKLTKAAKLKAPHTTPNFAGSWADAAPQPLPAGTTLRVVEPVRETQGGPVVAYLVTPPDQARGYVETRLLHRASDAEVEAFRQKVGLQTIKGEGVKPGPGRPEAATPGDTHAAEPAGAGGGIDLTKPIATGEPGKTAEPAGGVPPDNAGERKVGSVDDLETVFQRVWKEPAQSAEIDELIAEYQRAIDASGAGDSYRTVQLQRRVDALKLRKDLREKIRKAEEARAALDADNQKLAEQLAAWERTRVYTIIGKVQPSTLYDGKRLPKMYRVVSVGAVDGRTLGYLKENPEVPLEKYLGQVVGVVGEASLDRSLKLNLIKPLRVDRLRAEDGKFVPAPASSGDAKPETSPAKAPEPAPSTTKSPEDMPDNGG